MNKIKSRKLWVLIIGIALQLVNSQLKQPMTDEQLMQLSVIIATYLVAQGWVDRKENGK